MAESVPGFNPAEEKTLSSAGTKRGAGDSEEEEEAEEESKRVEGGEPARKRSHRSPSPERHAESSSSSRPEYNPAVDYREQQTMETRPGDWTCPSCSAMNFATRNACFRCRTPHPTAAGTAGYGAPPPGGEMRPGDWFCVSCGTHNFASRMECKSCRLPKPAVPGMGGMGGMGGAPSVREGDWFCSCGAHNFASRMHCMKCESRKPRDSYAEAYSGVGYGAYAPPPPYGGGAYRGGGAFPPPTTSLKPGDWPCDRCGYLNFASRPDCRECHTPRPAGTENNFTRPGDWNCPSCSFLNFSSRDECLKCRTRRP